MRSRKFKLTNLFIYVTKRCNSRCPNCLWILKDVNFFNKSVKEDMSFDRAKDISEFYKKNNVKIVRIQAEGEVFLYTKFKELTLFCKSIGYDLTGFPTNGLLLHKYDEFVLEHFPSIMVSIDGYDAEGYIKYRGGNEANFDKILDNIRKIVKMKKNKFKTVIGINCIITSQDYEKAFRMIKLSEKLGIDRIRFGNYHPYGKEDDLKPVSNKILKFLHKKAKSSKVRVNFPKTKKLLYPFFCSQLFDTVLVGTEGDFSPCCQISCDPKWGNFYERKGRSLLSRFRDQFRSAKSLKELPEYCSSCPRLRSLK